MARDNHKVNSVGKYHQFLNKTQAIAGQYCGSRDLFLQHSKESYYACNRDPIDYTNVMRIVAAVSRELIFTLDTQLLLTPTFNPNNNQSLFKSLQDVYMNYHFTSSDRIKDNSKL